MFESKPIKRGGKIPFRQFKTSLELQKQMSFQIINNYMTTPTFPNPYITRKLNNIDKAKVFKNKQDD